MHPSAGERPGTHDTLLLMTASAIVYVVGSLLG